MESANFNHHQQQEDEELADSSPFSTPSCYGLSWSQNPILTDPNNSINSRNLVPCPHTSTNPMLQDLGFPWSTNSNYPIDNFMNQELQRLGRIKDEHSVSESYPRFLEMLNSSPTSSVEDLHYIKNDHGLQIGYSFNNQDFLLTSFSSGCRIEGGHMINDQNSSNGAFSQILPTTSIPNWNQSSSSSSSSSSSYSAISSKTFDMNCLPALDLFGSPRFSGNFSHPSSLDAHNIGGLSKDTCLSYGFDQMYQPNHRPVVCPSKISSASTTGSTDQTAKRPASNAKATQSTAPKKSKLESRPASAPFQVRKEKLGDRIAAIQQLVAPFGKTDTASVLMEAIGYIKFLQTQVETLSVPYMKSPSTREGQMMEGNQKGKGDLRSRGLCLVPLSCLSYVIDGDEGIWPAP